MSRSPSNKTNLAALPLEQRWEQIGSRDDLEELIRPKQLAGHDQLFVRIASSQRLAGLNTEPKKEPTITMEAEPRPSNPYAPVPKAKPKKKMLKKYARGEFIDLVMGKEKAPEVGARGLPFDPLESVLEGMQDFRSETGPGAQVNQRRSARFKCKPMPQTFVAPRQKAPALGPQPLLAESLSPKHREKRRCTAVQRRLALVEFSAWLERVFDGLEALWSVLCEDGHGFVGTEDFAEALASRDYPMGGLGAKTLFFFLDADGDGAITLEDARAGLEEADGNKEARALSPKSWDVLSMTAAVVRNVTDQDPVEEYRIDQQTETLVRRGNERASRQDGKDVLLRRMWREDPEVAEFFEFVFSEFRSIQMAWRIMDVKRTGIMCQEDFLQSVGSLCSRNGDRPAEVHMENLFDLLDAQRTNRVKLCEIFGDGSQSPLAGRLALVDRLRRFLHEPQLKEAWADTRGPEAAFETLAGGRVTRVAFLAGLERLRYKEWHINSLFDKFDRDGSGDINMDDLVNFLKEAGPGANYHVPEVQVPLGTQQRQRLVMGDFSSVGHSAKLSQMDDYNMEERLAQRLSRTPISAPCSVALRTSTSATELLRERLGRVESPKKQAPGRGGSHSRPSSQQSRRARKDPTLSFSFDSVPDLVPLSCALRDFDESPHRNKVDHCYHPA